MTGLGRLLPGLVALVGGVRKLQAARRAKEVTAAGCRKARKESPPLGPRLHTGISMFDDAQQTSAL